MQMEFTESRVDDLMSLPVMRYACNAICLYAIAKTHESPDRNGNVARGTSSNDPDNKVLHVSKGSTCHLLE